MNRLKYILQHRYLFKALALFILIIAIIYTNVYEKKSKYIGIETEFTGIVYKKKIRNKKVTLYIKAKMLPYPHFISR